MFFFLKLKQASARDLLGSFATDADLDHYFKPFMDLTKDEDLQSHGSNPGLVVVIDEQVKAVINAAMERENKLNEAERLVLLFHFLLLLWFLLTHALFRPKSL